MAKLTIEEIIAAVKELTVVHAGCNSFGRVENTAAADRKDQLNVFFFTELHALVDERELRVGFNAAQFDEGNACLVQRSDDLLIQTDPFDAAGTVVEQHLVIAVRLDHLADFVLSILSEEYFSRGVILEVFHFIVSFAVFVR